MSKRSKLENPLIAHTSEIKKIKEQWIESSKTNLPLVIIGDSGVGKSFWIEASIEERVKDNNFILLKVDYSQREEFYETVIKKIKKNQLTVIWWENLAKASESEIRHWFNWWKLIKYDLPESLYVYWEIQTEELEIISKNSQLKELYDFFKAFRFEMFPLHRRQSDLPFFIIHFLEKANKELKKNVTSLDEQFHHFFTKRNFKHNLHDLRDFIYSLVAFSTKKHVKFNHIPEHFFENETYNLNIKPGITLQAYEKEIISENLRFVKGNRTKAAKLLGISERNLYRKIKDYQLEDES